MRESSLKKNPRRRTRIPLPRAPLRRAAGAESPRGDAPVVLYAEGKGRHVLEVEVRVRLARQGGWRVAEAAVPAAPASTLAIKVPAGGTEVRLGQVPDRRSYDTEKDGQAIDTVLGAGGGWRSSGGPRWPRARLIAA